MATDILMPQLGESVTEGTIAKWLKKPGDPVSKYEPICEVSTDKVNAEVPSTIEGTIVELVVEEGTTVSVGDLICRIQEAGTAAAEEEPKAEAAKEEKASAKAEVPAQEETSMKQRYSPAVLKLANEHNIDLTRISGTGRGGRITRKDILRAIEQGVPAAAEQPVAAEKSAAPREETKPEPAQPKQPAPVAEAAGVPLENGDIEIPVTAVRRTIAQRMVQSKHEAPHAWTMMEVDVTGLVELRNRLKEDFKKREGVNLTFMPFFIKAVVDSLKEFPYLNSVWGGDKIILKKRINISIAVATDDALYVPVIHDADEKSILGLARAVSQLAEKTRAGKLDLKDMQGGTFTVNNTGSFGSVLSAPIINHPQAAILSFESIVKRPVVTNQMIAVRDMMNICLSLDHRILDGLMAGRFLKRVKERLEAYGPNSEI
ncbi:MULTISPECIES: dihydrolipoamide acetyltransferase family protein [Thermoactinomyces]|jgi:2-oxoisovalerate dehydrogenase E2 component (dihydrolipoyl transacylase)|uniref:Dihydrolipoamide acetyltransferase component of pyruvate dehydrogenase complex n=1 Tax=Thermoactinomyces daqus TaxID=1329516 RepID=A0A7W1XAB6_9BACL|nr:MULTISPECIES: dihydrolipoamide acetyltransferase family protein [Thermoactinomyces]MBA4542947.1 2-oxo acid dehydrogenase subunit E2 [Thermoactinomyces daqus]MBH8596719.1 2-oxo acid dehydrogenase subunit E2 [Thermoactinomyces sp. CICC 10523]MBH8606645.1 2-oxo acid dehydrogenase subunit E2 [Thermoactinomyces sp. CICC 10521]